MYSKYICRYTRACNVASLDPWPADGAGARERHIDSPSLVTGSARAKQKHVLRRGGEGKGSKQANKEGGPPLHATHPSHGPPATHNLYLHEIARSCISHTQNKKLEEPPYAHVICPCVSAWGGAACRWVVVSSFRVMMIGDDIFFSFNYSPLSVPACALAELAELAESPRTYTSSRFPKIGRQAGSNFWTGPNGRAI